jgi:acyl-CoA synthetase (AMP-forming)/AMP-acid ligase II
MTRPYHKFWPKRLPHAINPPAMPLWDNLAISARRYPHKPAVIFFGREFRYADLARMTERLAARLFELGVRKGDRVILDMQNCPQLVIAHFAILRANAVVVPVNPMNRAEELKHYITDPDAKVAITTGDLAAELVKASDALPAADRLEHLIVTQFTDCMPEGATPDTARTCPRPGTTGCSPATRCPHWPAARCTRGPMRWPPMPLRPSPAWAPPTWPSCPTPAAPPACPRAACTRTAASCTTPWPAAPGAMPRPRT